MKAWWSIYLTRELVEIITSRVQKVRVVELIRGPAQIPQWRFLSVPVRAFEQGGVHPKSPPENDLNYIFAYIDEIGAKIFVAVWRLWMSSS